MWTILQSFGVWSKLKRWKSSISGCFISWLKIFKNRHFEVLSSLILHNEPFPNQTVTWDQMAFIWQPAMTSSVAGPKRSSKALPKAKLTPKKGYGHCLMVCWPSDPLQLSESWWNHYIWEVCSANQWDTLKTAMPAASTGQQKGPNSSPRQCPIACHTTNI